MITTRLRPSASQDQTEGHSYLPELAILTTISLWSLTFVVTKDQLDLFHPMAFIFVRFLLMALMAFGIMVLRERGVPLPQRRHLLQFIAAGLTGFTMYQLGFVLGLDRTSIFASSLLISTSPLFTMLFLTLIGERSPWLNWVGLAISVVGVAVFLMDKRNGERSLAGDLLSIMAAASFAAYGIINRPLVKSYPPVTYTFWTIAFGTVPLLLAGVPQSRAQDWSSVPASSWLAVLYMVIFPVYVAYMLWNFAIRHRGAALASSFVLLVPVLSGILSALFFDEQFGVMKVVGAALVFAGLLTMRLVAWRHNA